MILPSNLIYLNGIDKLWTFEVEGSKWPKRQYKRYPDGRINNYKARLCAHGGMQTHGVNCWDAYSPTVNWIRIRFVLVVSSAYVLKLNKSLYGLKQGSFNWHQKLSKEALLARGFTESESISDPCVFYPRLWSFWFTLMTVF